MCLQDLQLLCMANRQSLLSSSYVTADEWKQQCHKLAELIVRHCSHVSELYLPVRGVHSVDTLELLASLTSLQSLTVNSNGSESGPHAKVSTAGGSLQAMSGPVPQMHKFMFSR